MNSNRSEESFERPLEDSGRSRRIAPFAVVALAAFVAVLLIGTRSRAGEVIVAGLLVPALVASVYLVPWWRLPAWAQAAPPLLYFAIVALLRDATGADASIFTALVLLPVFWFALYGTRPQLLVSVAGVFVTLAAPALIVGAPDYPPRDELVRAFLWLMIAGALGLTVHRLVLEVRARFIEYRSILETAHESFIAAGPDGRIVDWNQQAERDFGWSREEVIGRNLAETVIPPRVRGVYAAGFDQLLRFGDHTVLGRRFEMPAMRRDGGEFPVEITVSALPSWRWLQAQCLPPRHLRAPAERAGAARGRGTVPPLIPRQRGGNGDRQHGRELAAGESGARRPDRIPQGGADGDVLRGHHAPGRR